MGFSGITENHHLTNVDLAGGGILLSSGVHQLSQLVYLFDEAEFRVAEASLIRVNELDAHVDATIEVQTGGEPILCQFVISNVFDQPANSEFIFDWTTCAINLADASARLQLQTSSDSFTIDPSLEFATTLRQAHYLRWRQFIDDLSGGNHDSRSATEPRLTGLIDDIYTNAVEIVYESASLINS